MANVQRQDCLAEQPTQPLGQTPVAIDHDLNHTICFGPETAARCFRTRPLDHLLPRGETSPDAFVDRTMQFAIFAATQCVHRHKRCAATVLALVASFSPLFSANSRGFQAQTLVLATMALAATATRMLPSLTTLRQFVLSRRRHRFAVHLYDQYFTIGFWKRRRRRHVLRRVPC